MRSGRAHCTRPQRADLEFAHDYFVVLGGAERVVATLHGLHPRGAIYTAAVRSEALPVALRGAHFETSILNRAPGIERMYRAYLPVYGEVFSRMTPDCELLLASSSAWAHRIRPTGALAVYCHTPPRFIWQTDVYLSVEAKWKRALGRAAATMLRSLQDSDYEAAQRVTVFIANSRLVAQRIERCYHRSAEVVHPPVDTSRFQPNTQEDFVLVVARLQPYKRIDRAIDVCAELGVRLVVVGDGPARGDLQRRSGPTVEFRGRLDDKAVASLMGRARALLIPGKEDFGLVAIEANASGAPVVASAGGGTTDVIREGETGVVFHEESVEGMGEALHRALRLRWDRDAMVAHARAFAPRVFQSRIAEVLAPYATASLAADWRNWA